MKILLFGRNGQVGWELQRALAPLGEVIALERRDSGGDFTKPQEAADVIRALRPQAIVNAAAYTAVDRAESEAQLARTINTDAPGALAQAAKAAGAWLVQYSTDYVFDGSGDVPRSEDAPTAPLSVYGQTKWEGEERIRGSGCRHLILRTSWVYAARGGNFAKTMLKLAAEREELRVIDDQIGAPTGADLIADVTAHVLRDVLHSNTQQSEGASGTYHVVAGGQTSWHGYARHVIDWAHQRGLPLRTAVSAVKPISTRDYPTPARRPLNSRLDTRKLCNRFALTLPPWQQGVDRLMSELHP